MGVAGAVASLFALLLVVSGVEKWRHSGGAQDALALVGMPAHPVLLVGLPAAEIGVAAVFLGFGGRWPALALCLVYASFAVVVGRELRRGSGSPCGCFGASAGKITRLHLVVDVVGTGAAGAAVVAGGQAPLATIFTAGWNLPLLVVTALTATALLRSLLVDMPPLFDLLQSREVAS